MMHRSTQYSPDKPEFLYDGDCDFCLAWVDYFQSRVGETVAFRTYQDAASMMPECDRDALARAVHLVEADGTVTAGAEATFRMLWYGGEKRWLRWLYENLGLFRVASEWFYRLVAAQRGVFYSLTKLCVGVPIRRPSYEIIRNVFLRGLGVMYLIALASFGVQISALIGSRGIVPASSYLTALWAQLGGEAVWRAPTLLWFSASDGAILLVLLLGLAASLGITCRVLQRTSLVVAFVSYLSLVTATQVFMSYQWDMLLLETGFLAVLFSWFVPAIWALRALLFKLVFFSGIGKLLSGDETWWNLTALDYHFMTQPLATPIAWYVHQLPLWIHKVMTLGVLAIELVVPVFFFAPRRIRFAAAWFVIVLEVLIMLTGNYTFFNLLTMLLALLLFDDRAVQRVLPHWLMRFAKQTRREVKHRGARIILSIVVAVLVFVSIVQGITGGLPYGLKQAHRVTQPFYISNTYGLFTTMTTSRPEIIMQGSYDGETWRTYDFAYKPGRLNEAPPIVAPHQPRIDWQMWFAALKDDVRRSPWMQRFVEALFQNDSAVTTQLAHNPFRVDPPNYIRAVQYEYEFTDEWGSEQWWKREKIGLYLQPVSREHVIP